MKMLSKILALIPLLLFTQFLLAEDQPKPPQTLEELKSAIEKIRKDTNTSAVGIALVNKDGPFWIAGLGEADVEKHTKSDENTMFRIASVSKMFVALSVLKLVEEGKLHLDDKLHDLAPEIAFDNKWEKTNPILLVHLLEHTTGWDEQHLPEVAFNASDSSTLKDALDFHPHSRTSRWVPGTRYAYNNIGPAVTAYVIEKITGKKYEDYVQENFFNNLQMSSTTFYNSETYKKHAATLYGNNGIEKYYFSGYRPSTSINSTPKEMANFLYLLMSRGKYNEQQLIAEKSVDRMELPLSNLGANQGITSGYGLHNHTTGHEDYGIALHGHGGDLPGALTAMMYSPKLKGGYIIMTNSSNGSIWQMTELVTSYLLKDAQKERQKKIELSKKFNAMPGLYLPINPRQEITRFRSEVFNIMKISVRDNLIHRSPLFGGWESSDYAIAENLAINPWTGLPSIAFVNDPLAGETLQIDGDLYKRVPSLLIYGGIFLFLILTALMIANIAFAFFWIPRKLLGKISGTGTIQVRTWPLLAGISILVTFLIVGIFEPQIIKLGTVTFVSVAIFVSSLLYPLFTALSTFSIYKYRNEGINKLIYRNAVLLTSLHFLFVVYLTYYGIIGFRGWAE
jgi:CubicO group peptidase (beta-lactamase class C family)